MSKRLALLIAIAAIGVGGWFLYQRYVVEDGPAAVFYGNVDIREVTLGFRVAGRVERMLFHEGDKVEAGELLAQLDTEPFEEELALRKAEVAEAQAQLAKLEAGTRPQEIERARADVEAREAALENARAIYGRQEKLVRRDFASQQAFDDALEQLKRARAALRSAKEALNLAIEGPRKEDVAAAEAALEAARAQKEAAQTALEDASLHASEDGVILTRAVEPGTIVSAGTPVYTLSLSEPVWVRAYVPEPQLGLVSPGTPVKVISDTRPDEPYDGQVGFVSPVAEFTPKSVETPELRADLVYRFRVVVKDPDDALRQGMPVTVRLAGDATDRAAKD
ncbi:secretion protein HlyD [Dichotomicrobium thermohalophilum]|uniref:HlyD family secretion protein n=1 Tax=Dichotomicrobium thermohalophilum TaxID=933063 RepID=A0A397Q4D1_9HYPH|nr:secretion protein HlyD [Dichotomicrobium thermohalophilum]RIA55992.1 HlyD family secretion protein [Dichotomicrobium thermohalophilum]